MVIVRRALVLVLVVGCGRFGFGTPATGDALGDDGGADIGDSPAPPSGLIVWFQFDNDNGTTFTDSISGLQGTCGAPGCPTLTTAGHRNSAYVFDGSNDCISIPDAPQLQQATFTIAAWGSQRSSALITRMSKQFAAQNNSWQLGSSLNDSAYFLYNAGTNDIGLPNVPNSIVLNTFQHVAATFDASSLIEVYVNGARVITDVPAGPIAYDANQAAIGCTAHASPSAFFDGTLDEIQIYNRVLTAAEIMQLAQQ